MDFNEIASVSGKGGLFKIINPTRTGVILQSLEDPKKKMVVGMSAKVSVLSDISIYTNDAEGSVPLGEVMKKIHKEFDGDTGLSSSSEPDELKAFLKFVLPEYDEDKVYASDIKKIVSWYHAIYKLAPELLTEDSTEDKEDDQAEEDSDKK